MTPLPPPPPPPPTGPPCLVGNDKCSAPSTLDLNLLISVHDIGLVVFRAQSQLSRATPVASSARDASSVIMKFQTSIFKSGNPRSADDRSDGTGIQRMIQYDEVHLGTAKMSGAELDSTNSFMSLA